MILCDIGNSYFHFYENGRMWREEIGKISNVPEGSPIAYISVNDKGERKLLNAFPHAINLSSYFYLDTIYEGLGIDRIAACSAISDGVVIDAGSAITIDIMQNGVHLGGYILPGLQGYLRCYRRISSRLGQGLNLAVDLSTFPQNTQDGISYGILKSMLMMIKNSSKSKMIYFTGGDGKFLSRYFDHALYDASLVFKGMMKACERLEPISKTG